MKNSNLLIFMICSSFTFAQVGINTTSPLGVLDVTSGNSAVVLPEMQTLLQRQYP
jgi:hypothetical protein